MNMAVAQVAAMLDRLAAPDQPARLIGFCPPSCPPSLDHRPATEHGCPNGSRAQGGSQETRPTAYHPLPTAYREQLATMHGGKAARAKCSKACDCRRAAGGPIATTAGRIILT